MGWARSLRGNSITTKARAPKTGVMPTTTRTAAAADMSEQ